MPATPAQLDLFDRGPPPPPPQRPPKWIAHRGPWGRNLRWTRDDMPTLAVRHCGHGTANYPYYITVGDDRSVASPGTFATLIQAQAAAVLLWQELSSPATPPQ